MNIQENQSLTVNFGDKLKHKETGQFFITLNFDKDGDHIAVVDEFGEVYSVDEKELEIVKEFRK